MEKRAISNKISRKAIIRILSVTLVVLTILFFAMMGKAYFDGKFNSVESMRAFIRRFGVFGPLILTLFQAFQVVIPILPGFLGCGVGSALFGPFVGFLCNYIGISAGSVIAFLLAKRHGLTLVKDLFPAEKYGKWSDWIAKSKSYTAFLFLAMLLPLFPDDYLCYLTGLSKMSCKRFSWIILLGKPWTLMAYCYGFDLFS